MWLVVPNLVIILGVPNGFSSIVSPLLISHDLRKTRINATIEQKKPLQSVHIDKYKHFVSLEIKKILSTVFLCSY